MLSRSAAAAHARTGTVTARATRRVISTSKLPPCASPSSRREQDLARAAAHALPGPRLRVEARRRAPAVDHDLVAPLDSPDVDREDDARRAEARRALLDQPGRAHGHRVEGDPGGAGREQVLHVLGVPHAAADREPEVEPAKVGDLLDESEAAEAFVARRRALREPDLVGAGRQKALEPVAGSAVQ